MQKLFRNFLIAFAVMFINIAAFAQVTTSNLMGRVTDDTSNSVPGVTVIASHTPSGTTYWSNTNNEGNYSIENMRTGGPYTITYSILGYKTLVIEDVVLQLGETFTSNVTLQEDTEELSEVVVISSASKFNTIKTGASTNITNRDITSLPSINRSINDLIKLSPYSNGMSFAGSDGRSSNFTVDGANLNNNFGLSSALPGGGTPISVEALDEIQIIIAPYDVRQTNFIGGGVNAITKSGTNTFKSSAYVYYQDQNMQGSYVENTKLDKVDEQRKIYGFTLGGPIVKDKLFFFVNYEGTIQPGQVIGYRANNGSETVSGNVSRTLASDMQKVQEYAKSKYGYDTGSYTNFPGDESNHKFLARLDWNINNDHKVSLRYNYVQNRVWNAPNGNSADTGYRLNGTYRVGSQSMAFANNMYSMDNKVQTISAELNSRLSNNLSNQFLTTFSKIDDVRGSNSTPFPHVDIMTLDESAVGLGNNPQPYMSLGYELFTWNNGVHNNVLTVKDDFTIKSGKHKTIIGVNYEHQFANNSYMRNGTMYYRYKSLDDFLNARTPESFAITYGWNGEMKPTAQVTFNQIGLYAQDEWSVNDKLKLTYGVRFDNLIFDNSDIATNKAIYKFTFRDNTKIDTGVWPRSRIQTSPRIGFTYNPNNNLTLRGGTGLFQGRLPLVFFTNMPTNAGLIQNQVQFKSTWDNGTLMALNDKLHAFDGGMITNVSEAIEKLGLQKELSDENHVASSTISGVDPNFKMPQVWKTSFAVDYRLPVDFPFNVTVEGIFNKAIYDVIVDNINLRNDTENWDHFVDRDSRLIYPKDVAINSGYNAPYLTNTNKGYGYTANITVNAEPIKDLRVMAAYTYTESKEISGLPGSDPLSTWQGLYSVDGPNFATLQRSQYVVPNKVIASVNYQIPIRYGKNADKIELGLFYTGFSPYGYSYCYTNDMNGDGIANDLMFIYENGYQINWKDKSNIESYARIYDDFVNQDKYLRKHRGEYAEAYSARAPFVNRFDFKFAYNFKFTTGKQNHNLQFVADVFNIGNILNSSWGVYKNNSISNNSRILTYEGKDEYNHPMFSLANNANGDFIKKSYDYFVDRTQCWRIQLGLKYLFN